MERLISLTFQLSETPAERLIHALALIILRREEQAVEKLNTLKDHDLAKHLAERWERSQGQLEDFATSCVHMVDFNMDSLVLLARVFKVLSDQRLCDVPLRNLAYKRALSGDNQKTSTCVDQAYEDLKEEAKMVCGFEEWVHSTPDLRSSSHQDSQSSFGRGSTTSGMTLVQEQLEGINSLPSPLKASSMAPSYPSHLEISIPPTALYAEERSTPEMSQTGNNEHLISGSEANVAQADSQPTTSESSGFAQNKHPKVDEKSASKDTKLETLPGNTCQPSLIPTPVASTSQITMSAASVTHEQQEAEECEEEDEETTFYAFVILHAPVDAEMADSMRVRLESIIGREGATFSDDFAMAGKSTLRCVEDAINNTAFTILLLTQNFNTHMQDLETNSALLNSVNKAHKHNTVIPLLPQQNRMATKDISMVLQTITPLVEDRNFERKVKRSMSQGAIRKLHKVWIDEQKVKSEIKKQERLKQLKQHNMQFIREVEKTQLLESENIRLRMAQRLFLGSAESMQDDSEECRAWWRQQQPNIHINNAKYIMIGNDSQMTVDLGGGVDLNDSEGRGEEDRT